MPQQPRIPAVMPGRSVALYPTPLITDTIETETVDAVAGSYFPMPFGTKYSEVEHGAFQLNLPDHVLISDTPVDASGATRKRMWAANRDDQDIYNFSIAFENQDPQFPNYTRTYILEREGYTPLEVLSPDPFDPFAFLAGEQVSEDTDPPELKNWFLKVVRVYMTLPGPLLYSIEYPYGGNPSYPRITTKQKFAHMAFADTLGSKCPIQNYTDATLIAQTIQQTEMAGVDLVQRIYDVVPQIVFGNEPGINDDYKGQEGYGYSIGYINGESNFPFVTWKFVIDKEDYQPAPDLSPCPIKGFEKLRLVNQGSEGDDKQNQLLHIERRYETLPGPVIHKIDFDNNDPSYPILSTVQRIAFNEYNPGSIGLSTPDVGGYTNLLLFEQHLVPSDFGTIREDQRIYELNPSNIVTSYDYDSAIDAFVQTQRQKCLAGLPGTLDVMTLEYREKPVDKYRTIQIRSKLVSLPAPRVEYKTVNNWPFPTLLTGIAMQMTGLVANRNEVVWYPNTLRPIQNVPAILRVTTTYYTSLPPAETIFVLPTRNIIYRGISFELSINNVLNNAISLSVQFTNDTKYGGLREVVTFAATNPSADQYYAVIGQYRTVACDITLWRGKIYVKNVSEVILV